MTTTLLPRDGAGAPVPALMPVRTQVLAVSSVSAATANVVGRVAHHRTALRDPSKLGGLLAWFESFDAATIDGSGSVRRWRDKSGRGNDGVAATDGEMPLVTADGLRDGIASVTADGINDKLDLPLLIPGPAHPLTVVGVARSTQTGAAQRIINFMGPTGTERTVYVRFASDDKLEMQARALGAGDSFSAKSVGNASDGAYHAFCGRLNATPGDVEIALDTESFVKTAKGSAFAATALFDNAMLLTGIFGGAPSHPLEGDVVALAVYDRALSDAEWVNLRDGYLLPLLFPERVQVVRLASTTDCHIAIGAAPTATTSDMLLPAGIPEYIHVRHGIDKVAAIRASADGTLLVTEVV